MRAIQNYVSRISVKLQDFNYPIIQKIIYSFAFALLTAYGAQLKFFLPWTPVPITFQTFFVLLSGLILGSKWGSLSQIIYVSCGALGVPFFSGMESGVSIIFGPRGGYLTGFILTSYIVGYLFEKFEFNFFKSLAILNMAYFVVMYSFGCAGLGIWLFSINGAFPSFYSLMAMGVLPFILGDLIKILLVSIVENKFVKKYKV